MESNITFLSNVYPVKSSISSDKQFLENVYDYSKLKGLKNKFFSLGNTQMLTKTQLDIINQGTICAYAKDDPCWGLLIEDGLENWGCKCVNKECQYMSSNICPSSIFVKEEYHRFSPDVVNTIDEYRYINVDSENITYYPILLDDSVTYETENLLKLVKNTTEEKKNTDEKIEIIKVIENQEKITNEESKSAAIEDENDVPEQIPNFISKTKLETSDELSENVFEAFVSCEQDDIIQTSTEKNIFVNAGPGTGKTYTLISKINHMVTKLGVDPESIQVLSFTNSAVSELKERLNELVKAGGNRGLRNVDIRTFHSFAWWLIGQANDFKWCDIRMGSLNYDKSIAVATNIISTHNEVVGNWEHFFVDEVQDLTDDRARFVITIINACLNESCGITVLGDSCQAIYDYNQKRVDFPFTSTKFYECLYNKMKKHSKFLKLNINHRQTDDLINKTINLREAILGNSITQMKNSVRALKDNMPELRKSSLDITMEELNNLRDNEKICLLCRNNGQTLQLSSNLRKRGISHILNAYETNDNYASWIGKVFYSYAKDSISYDNFELLYNSTKNKDDKFSAEDIWNRLQQLLHTGNNVLIVKDIIDAIMKAKIDDPIFRVQNDSPIIVSNIHRAKGREYQSVVVDSTFMEDLISEEKDIGEYKTLYVAVTRPKEKLFYAPLIKNDVRSYTIHATNRKRWIKSVRKEIKYIEFKNDIDNDVMSYIISGDITQKYINQKVKVGDEIKLVINVSGNTYDIVHCFNDVDSVIGKVSNSFLEDLFAWISPKTIVELPSTIEGLYISSVYTHFESSDSEANYPELTSASKNNIWCWVEICGLGHATYDIY